MEEQTKAINTTPENLLPYDGEVRYFGCIMDGGQADVYLQKLLNEIEWRNDEAVIFGKHIITKRKVAWYADGGFSYSYSNITRYALPWTATLVELKAIAEELTGVVYNSCLLNLYHDGDEGMAWHSDDEKELKKDGSIASMSFGAERKFALKHRLSKEGTSLMLQNGSLLEMKGTTQTYWLHALPKSKKVKMPRVNLTFRQMMK
ncbi:alpha-ketoglutarate-dependent dioxygenase AlkB [Mucilaginibacter sp. RS28]|uniref:Alpha-ketoglutarate-dependent dioxygenase AlkB n=1 Tax=Mucilaginibacter straminoryzae TaxID=2932774 RepID=A0A9X2BBX2_9SPHI|nr:alpha-ketoglutarate-dependent dioxygenase AlkB [Mucilaginibacter straminoryzae]MCJ8208713.1 alpha-ketoglutarate-dependent dioxygenase AlkB [Mucilaginibacter straminoryzae]